MAGSSFFIAVFHIFCIFERLIGLLNDRYNLLVIKKRTYPVFLFFLFVLHPCFSQSQHNDLDSLRNAMQHASREADRLHAAVLLAQDLMPAQMDSARVLLEEAYPLEDAPELRQQAQYFNVWGLYYWFRGDRQASISWFSQTLSLPGDASFLDLQAAAANNTGAHYYRLGEPDSARIYLLRALEIDTRRDYTPGMAKTKYDLSRLFASQSQYELALTSIRESIRIKEEQDDIRALPFAYNVLGNVLKNLGEPEEAAEAYWQSYHQAYHQEDQNHKIVFYNNMAALLNDVTAAHVGSYLMPDTVLHYTRQGLELAKEIENEEHIAALLINEAQAWFLSGDYERALELYDEIFELITHPRYHHWEMEVTYRVGKIYRQLGFIDDARQMQVQSLELARARQSVGRQSEALLELAALDSLEGNYGGFARNYARGIELRDSIWNQENRSRIAELQIIHETEQKEGEIEQLRQQEQLRQLRMKIVTAGSGLVLVLLLLFIFYLRKWQILIRQQYQMKQQQVESELEANHRELTGKALSLARSDQLIRKLKKDIQGLMDSSEGDNGQGLKSVMRLLKSQDNSQQLWKEFETRFNELNEGFISRLTERYPSLSPAEIRLCALLRLQMSTKEIADMLNRSPRTIEYTRNSLRKKMILKNCDNLVQHLLKI